MPTILSRPAPDLTLTTTGDKTEIRVQYSVEFTRLEKHLSEFGLSFRERVEVLGIDPPGGFKGTVLCTFPVENIPIPPVPIPALVVKRDRRITVPRSSLQEDPAIGDADEIRCKMTIESIGLPGTIVGYTDQEILLG